MTPEPWVARASSGCRFPATEDEREDQESVSPAVAHGGRARRWGRGGQRARSDPRRRDRSQAGVRPAAGRQRAADEPHATTVLNLLLAFLLRRASVQARCGGWASAPGPLTPL